MAVTGGPGFGIIGLGMISEYHAQAIKAMERGYLACCYDKSPQATRSYGAKVYAGDELEQFLKHPGLEVVTIATPSGAHLEPALAAACAKKHIICEKPLEVTLERCDELINACRKHKVKLAGIFPSRFGAAAQLVKQALTNGRFGRLTVCNALIPWHRTQQYYDSGGWRGTWELDGGGALMNQSIHSIDLLQWLAGPIAEVSAYAACLIHKRIDVEDAAVAAVRFRCGALGTIVGSTAMFPGLPAELQISGERGSAWLRGGHLALWQFDVERSEDAKYRAQYGPPPSEATSGGASDPRSISFAGHQRQFENFVRCLDGKDDLPVDGREARKAVEVILGIYQSALSKKAVKLPLRKTPVRRKFH